MTTEDLEKLSAYARKVIEAKGYTFYRAVYEQGIKDAERFYGITNEKLEASMTKERKLDEKPVAYWDTQNGTLTPAVPLSSERTCFKVPLVPLYLRPRADIVDELLKVLIVIGAGQGDPKEVAIQALENYMEEK